MTFHFPFENTYARLPDRFFARVGPTPVAAPQLIRLNVELARELSLDPDWLAGAHGLDMLMLVVAAAGHVVAPHLPGRR